MVGKISDITSARIRKIIDGVAFRIRRAALRPAWGVRTTTAAAAPLAVG